MPAPAVRELCLADYVIDDAPTQANRDGFKALLSFLENNRRTKKVWVPDNNGVPYRIPITSADKMTSIDVNTKKEQGDAMIARFLVNADVTFYGDGPGSVIEFVPMLPDYSAVDPNLAVGGFKSVQPYSLKLDDLKLFCTRPSLSTTYTGMSIALYVPPRTGNPTGAHYLTLRNVDIDGFTYALYVPSGPVTSINNFTVEISGGPNNYINGAVHAIALWSDPNAAGTKSLNVRGPMKLRGLDKTKPWSSHVCYVHPNVNFRIGGGVELDHWAGTKYGIAHWGNASLYPAKYSEIDQVIFGAEGDGTGIITSPLGQTRITRSNLYCRLGVASRLALHMSGCLIQPRPTIFSSMFCVTTLGSPDAEVVITDSIVDLSHVGPCQAVAFDPQNGTARWDLQNVWVVSKTKTHSASIFSSAADPPEGKHSTIFATNVHGRFYSAPSKEEWKADPTRSKAYFAAMRQGHIVAKGCSFRGDASHDRGCIRLDNAQRVVAIELDATCDIQPSNGMALYTDATSVGKVKGTPVIAGWMEVGGGGKQSLRFPDALNPVTVPAAETIVLDPRYRQVRVVGPTDPAAPPVVIRNVRVQSSTNVNALAAYAGAPFELLGDNRWELGDGGNITPAFYGPRALRRLRVDDVSLRVVEEA